MNFVRFIINYNVKENINKVPYVAVTYRTVTWALGVLWQLTEYCTGVSPRECQGLYPCHTYTWHPRKCSQWVLKNTQKMLYLQLKKFSTKENTCLSRKLLLTTVCLNSWSTDMRHQKFSVLKGNILETMFQGVWRETAKREDPGRCQNVLSHFWIPNVSCLLWRHTALDQHIYTCLDFYSHCKRICFSCPGTTRMEWTGNVVKS